MRYFSFIRLVQAFGFGAILMAYIADYNRSQLPLALVMLILGVIISD